MLHQITIGSLPAIVGGVLLCCQPVSTMAVEPVKAATQPEAPPRAPSLTISFSNDQLHLSWNAIKEATYYQICQAANGASHFSQTAWSLTATSYGRDLSLHRNGWSAVRYRVEACNAAGCAASNEVNALDAVLRTIDYFAISHTKADEHPTVSIALSGDGSTLAVGAPDDSSAGIGIDDNQTISPRAASSGAAYVFTRSGDTWSRQAYLKASNTSAGASFGFSIAVSNDGNTLVVGAYLEDSPGFGVNGNQGGIASNSSNAGAAYVFTRRDGHWSQQAYLKAFNPQANAYFGRAVSISGDGDTVAVGAIGENAGGLNAGAVYVYARNKGLWSPQAYVKAADIRTNAYFGSSVALNSDGNVLSVAEHNELGGATTRANGEACDGLTDDIDPVHVFARDASVWSHYVHVRAFNTWYR